MWLALISFCVFFTLVMSLAFCLCWKTKRSTSELTGVDGLVIKKNPDENVNHLPSAVLIVVDDVPDGNSDKRATIPSNTRRSLPDIPFEQENRNYEALVDNSSEHYATVEQYQNSIKRHTLPNDLEARSGVFHNSTTDAGISSYERVKYDEIRSREHPYAQLQPNTSRSSKLVTENISEEEPGRSQRTDHPFNDSNTTLRGEGGNSLDIPAASAVAGGIAASPELPYMTPPVQQTNFSGDSQDSSKGYTSISVREPLANILAQTKEGSKKRDLNPHYSTVSDDSDDVYTTIQDPNQVYTSESETYARIPPEPITVEAEINQCSRSDSNETSDEMYEPIPQPIPPSVDTLKYASQAAQTQVHSRQASSSSSTANVGSPKVEKRQANSPLPPPPQSDANSLSDKKLPVGPNIDALYAKVQKKKLRSSSEEESCSKMQSESQSAKERKIFNLKKEIDEHNYETLRKTNDSSDPDYERIKPEEPGYASIKEPESICSSDPGYEVLKDKSSSDPNYEKIKPKYSSDDVGYSRIEDTDDDEFIAGYSVVDENQKVRNYLGANFPYENRQSDDDNLDEPNYESMPSESISEIHYEGLKSSGSETDPNYESVIQTDSNYETVKYADEPPYEKVDGDLLRPEPGIPSSMNDDKKEYSETNGLNGKSQIKREESNISHTVDSETTDSCSKTGNSQPTSVQKSEYLADISDDNPSNLLDENVILEV